MKRLLRFAALLMGSTIPLAPAQSADPSDPHPVLELRQYRIVDGKRDEFIGFFESHFVESQEEQGMTLIGQFRDLADPSRFTWLRSFPSMGARGKSLEDFYYGPVWQANRATANPLLDDNDDVLLLRPAWTGSGFTAGGRERAAPGAPEPAKGLIIAHVEYLWKMPEDGYLAFFKQKVAPAYEAAGLPILATYVPETQPNNFPRLHVRQGERLLVWFTRAPDRATYDADMRRLSASAGWITGVMPAMGAYRERDPQILMLSPTSRSALR